MHQEAAPAGRAGTAPPRKVIPIAAGAGDAGTTGLYAASRKIYPRSIDGLFARWRWAFVFLTQALFYGLAWLPWGERQMLLFDLAARRFYILGLVLYPQDLIYLAALLVISALSLFLFTAVAGRLWCGFACPQTVYTSIFLWVERRIEGDRGARLRLDKGPLSAGKLARKAAKHALWVLIALWTGFSFVGYFTPIRELGHELLQWRAGPWEAFWIGFYAFATWGNAGFMREQVCRHMCPYARFQSAMFDRDTLIVGYDTRRGEPRGARRKDEKAATARGDCIDCSLCVQVCPAGIDIRDGLQYECIGCGLCVDACNSVMDKLRWPRGLIRFDSLNGLEAGWTLRQLMRRLFRPRVLVYTVLLWALILGLLASLWLRAPLKVDVVRDRAALARIVEGGRLENVYRLQLMNATERTQRYAITARGLQGLSTHVAGPVEVGPAQSRWVAVRLQIPYGSAGAGAHALQFDIAAEGDAAAHVSEKSSFLVPR